MAAVEGRLLGLAFRILAGRFKGDYCSAGPRPFVFECSHTPGIKYRLNGLTTQPLREVTFMLGRKVDKSGLNSARSGREGSCP